MRVVVAGGHGQIAMRFESILRDQGDEAVGIVRNPGHEGDLRSIGIAPVLVDLEAASVDDVAQILDGADAAVFAAGAGPGSGPARKRTVDLGAAVKLLEASERAGVRRYLIVSSIGAHDPAGGGSQMGPYLKAKADADDAVAASSLEWTIVRPGSLTDDPGTGRVRISTDFGSRGRVPRDDVAAVLAASLREPATVGKTFELFAGDTEIAQALRSL